MEESNEVSPTTLRNLLKIHADCTNLWFFFLSLLCVVQCTNKTREKSKDIDKIKKELEKIQKKQEQNENWDTLNTPGKVP